MRLRTATLLIASAIAVTAATPSRPEAQGDLTLRVTMVDEASGAAAVIVAPAPQILLELVQGSMPAMNATLRCDMLHPDDDKILSCANGKNTIVFRPRGFMLTSRPPGTWAANRVP